MLCILSGARVIQIPVNYKERVGQSMVCGNRWVAALLGLRMAVLITTMRLASWLRPSSFRTAPRGAAMAANE